MELLHFPKGHKEKAYDSSQEFRKHSRSALKAGSSAPTCATQCLFLKAATSFPEHIEPGQKARKRYARVGSTCADNHS